MPFKMTPYDKNINVTNLIYPMLIQPLYEGVEATFMPDKGLLDSDGKLFTNSNLPLYFSSLDNCGEVVLDGIIVSSKLSIVELGEILSTDRRPIHPTVRFIALDAVPLSDWQKRACKLEYDARMTLLRQRVGAIADYVKITDVSTDKVNTSGNLITLYKNYLTDGNKGVTIRGESGLYVWRQALENEGFYKLQPNSSDV